MKPSYIARAVCCIFLLAACSSDDDTTYADDNQSTTEAATDVLTACNSSGDVATFDITFDKTALSETQSVDSEDDDYVENTTFDHTLRITFSTTGDATVTGEYDTENTFITIDGNDVTVDNSWTEDVICYILSGTTHDGYFKLYSNRKQCIRLDGVSITNPDGAAINNQSKKRTFIILSDGTENHLADGTAYADATDGEDMKACLFSEGQLIFSGKGYLEVDGNCKAGIRSDDYVRTMPGVNIYVDTSSGNGIRGNDAVVVSGGVLNVNVTATAGKGISTDGYVQIDGGRTTVITSGGYEYDEDDKDYSACAGIKADATITINDGLVRLKSTGTGGKGISCDGTVTINGGTTQVITTGQRKKDSSGSTSPKGIKADGDITTEGGLIQVRCEGTGDGTEGIESKGEMLINGGIIESYCYDDALNSAGNLTVSGGYVYARSTHNDGIDANKNLYFTDGVTLAEGAGQAECGIDAAEGYTAYINGGTLVAIGGNLQEVDSSSKQASIVASVSTGTTIGLLSQSTAILGYTTPGSNTGSALMISSPHLTAGQSYGLRGGCMLSGGSAFYNLRTGCAIGSGSQTVSVTAATGISGSMGGGGMPPGGGGRP